MSRVVFRFLPLQKGGNTVKLLNHCMVQDVPNTIIYNIRHHHIALSRRLNRCCPRDRCYVGGALLKSNEHDAFRTWRLASTFTVETPGRFPRKIEGHEHAPALQTTQPAGRPAAAASDPIPEPPPVPEVSALPTEEISAALEPTFASIGLGGWSPVGIIENCMEFLHIDCGLPWWSAIALGTCVVRIVLFPLVIIAQKNSAKLNNNLPQMQMLQMKMSEARQTGNQLEAARYAQEMMLFMKEKELNPFKNMLVPLAQAPIFISFFMALRGMANTPVPSMTTGGMLWFTDLTMSDQYFLLPIITSATLYLTIELGADSARLNASNMQFMKYVLRALPICIFPFTMNFPGAVLCYWVSTNFISLLQVGFLRIPAVREYFKIDPMIHHKQEDLPIKNKGFVKGMQESWTNMKITREMEERERFDEIQFQRAGRVPLQKTYKYDPTQPRDAVVAKKRDP